MNGSSKFSSLSSPIVPEPTNEKSFYNPFTVDLSLDNINQPTTGVFQISNKSLYLLYFTQSSWQIFIWQCSISYSSLVSNCFHIVNKYNFQGLKF